MTEWRDVPGYEGYYQASDDGQIRSVSRVLRPGNGAQGTPFVILSKNGVHANRKVAHLVMEAFVGPRPEGLCVLHWDDVKTNNHLSNLRYGTRSENKHDAVRNGIHHKSRRTHCPYGHEFSDENTAWVGRARRCRTCARQQSRESYARKQARLRGAAA